MRPSGEHVTLHEAMIQALQAAGRPLSAAELAAEVNRRGSYRKQDGSEVEASQIRARVTKYPDWFATAGGMIGLPDSPAAKLALPESAAGVAPTAEVREEAPVAARPMERESGYVSRYLTHFVGKGRAEEEQFALLKTILKTQWLTHPPHENQPTLGFKFFRQRSFSKNEMAVPEMICFCDIPEEHLAIHSRKYSRFGIVFDKTYLASEGANPVFYVATGSRILRRKPEFRTAEVKKVTVTSEEFEKLAREPADLSKFAWEARGGVFDEHLQEFWDLWYAKEDLLGKSGDCHDVLLRDRKWGGFAVTQVFGFVKFYDESLPPEHPDNYFMEREWRRFGNLNFDPARVVGVYLPDKFIARFREDCPEFASRARALSSEPAKRDSVFARLWSGIAKLIGRRSAGGSFPVARRPNR